MKVVVVGATKGMGRAIARRLSARGDELFLLGRDAEQLARCANDLQVRAGASHAIGHAVCDLEQPSGFDAALAAADEALSGFDTLIVTAGLFGTQDQLEADPDWARRVMTVNHANTAYLCELARQRLLSRGGGRLVVFSSVAGDRGRKPVILYGSSKAGLSHYLEGLDHKFRAEGLITLCVKPGFVKTGMTDGLKPPPFAGEPDQVAVDVIRAMDAGKALLYTPRMWALVMLVIRFLPRFIMRRIGF